MVRSDRMGQFCFLNTKYIKETRQNLKSKMKYVLELKCGS
jgi:hypothetical protein